MPNWLAYTLGEIPYYEGPIDLITRERRGRYMPAIELTGDEERKAYSIAANYIFSLLEVGQEIDEAHVLLNTGQHMVVQSCLVRSAQDLWLD